MPKVEDNKPQGEEGKAQKKFSCRKLLQHKGKALSNPRFIQLFEPMFGLGLWVWLGGFFLVCSGFFFKNQFYFQRKGRGR